MMIRFRWSWCIAFSVALMVGCDTGGNQVIEPGTSQSPSEEERDAAVKQEYEEMEQASRALEDELQSGR